MQRNFICISICVCVSTYCNAQQVIPATGGESSGAGGTLSFTVGQINYFTLTSEAGTAFQGIQQPLEILVLTGIEGDEDISPECTVYPNPATEILILRIRSDRFENLTYQLIDLKGKTIESREIQGTETWISLKPYLPGTYFLKVTEGPIEKKTFKIIKSNLL